MDVPLLSFVVLGAVVVGSVFFLIYWWTGSDKDE